MNNILQFCQYRTLLYGRVNLQVSTSEVPLAKFQCSIFADLVAFIFKKSFTALYTQYIQSVYILCDKNCHISRQENEGNVQNCIMESKCRESFLALLQHM